MNITKVRNPYNSRGTVRLSRSHTNYQIKFCFRAIRETQKTYVAENIMKEKFHPNNVKACQYHAPLQHMY